MKAALSWSWRRIYKLHTRAHVFYVSAWIKFSPLYKV
jgi:hypothetical protein